MNLSDSKKKRALAGVICGVSCLVRQSGEHGVLYRMLYT